LEWSAYENNLAYRNNLTLSTEKYRKVIETIDLKIIKGDAISTVEILAITKLEVALWCLAVDDISNV
jgi:hypothetical protein